MLTAGSTPITPILLFPTAPIVPETCVPWLLSSSGSHAFVMASDGLSGVVVCEGDHMMRPGQVATINVPAFSITGSVETGMFSDGAAWLPAIP